MFALLIAASVAYGALAGLLLPRVAYRFSVRSGQPWRSTCPQGHELTGPARAWLGTARCRACATDGAPAPAATVPATVPDTPRTADAGRVTGTDADPDASPDGPTIPEPARRDEDATDPAEETTSQDDSEDDEAPEAVAPVNSRATAPWFGPRTPVVAVVTALLCAALAASSGLRPETPAFLLLLPLGILLAVIDATVHRLPDMLTLPAAGAGAVLLGFAALGDAAAGSWATALLGGLALGAAYFILFLIHPSGLGFGDVKLALVLGVTLGWYGWDTVTRGFVLGIFYGGAYAFALLSSKRAGRRTAMPLGPSMLAGSFTALLLGGLGV
ncbi:Type IV leader peptidase family protein [Streptomyces sp. YIM 130001]|uniref:prepilin peptidase n=1 Tax=Streptomyces sp. YIM 130001 TaxID=2259644 RepID=UPI000E658366|nr:A24 family peptidase [Streptomyces sp. YIM 130001]RII20783.1 Type IV leader peptidase family protein [Streptomyces sp. YIM 130001]